MSLDRVTIRSQARSIGCSLEAMDWACKIARAHPGLKLTLFHGGQTATVSWSKAGGFLVCENGSELREGSLRSILEALFYVFPTGAEVRA